MDLPRPADVRFSTTSLPNEPAGGANLLVTTRGRSCQGRWPTSAISTTITGKYVEVKVDHDVLMSDEDRWVLGPVESMDVDRDKTEVAIDNLPVAGLEPALVSATSCQPPKSNVPSSPTSSPTPLERPMGKRRIRRTGHAEGEHGPKTEARIVEQLESGDPHSPVEAHLEYDRLKAAFEGKRRLVEDRQQHDEAEKNSEHKRLFEEAQRGRAQEGPSDNLGNLHGVLGSREHRADYKERGPDGLPVKEPP